MKVNRLYVKNFKNIKEIEIDSFKRVNVILGENGNGKSALLCALQFVVTNDLEEKIEEYVRWGTDKFEIECDFDHNGINYKYEIEGSKSCKKRLIIDDKEEFINSEATKKLAEVIDPMLAKYSAVSEQGKATTLLFQKPAERLKTIKEILKFDSIFEAVENIKEDVKTKKDEIDKIDVEQNVLTLRSYTYADENTLKKEVDADQGIEEKFKAESVNKEKFTENQKLQKKYEEDLKLYNDACKKIEEYNKVIDSLKKEIEAKQLTEEVKEYDDTELNSFKELLEDFKTQKIHYDNDIKAYEKARIELKSIEENITKYNEQLSNIKIERIAPCKFNDQTIAEVQSKINDLKVEMSQLEKDFKLAEQGKCPTCGSDLKEKFDAEKITASQVLNTTLLTDLNNELNSQKKEISEHQKKMDVQKEQLVAKSSIQGKIEFYEDSKNKYSSITKPVEFDQKAYDDLVNQITEETSKKESHNKKREQWLKVKSEIDSLNDKISFYNKEVVSWQDVKKPEELNTPIITFDENYYEDLKKRVTIKDQKVQEYNRAVEFNMTLKKEEEENKKQIKKNEVKKETLLKDINILSETRNVLEKDFSSFVVDKSVTFIKDQMNSFFQKTYSKYEVTVEQDKNSVNFFYKGDEEIITPCSMASGAERAILSVAFRVALCALQDLGILIIDEIDDSMSSNNSINIFSNLIDQKQFENIFIITHCNETKEYLENVPDTEIFEIVEGELA